MDTKNLHKFLATGFGSGYAPIAPGTAGSLVAVVLFYLYWQCGLFSYQEIQLINLGLALVFLFLGVWSSNVLESEWGKDPSKIVVDEMVGIWISLLWIPLGIWWLLAAFVLFRFFDILKPLGIRKMENLKGGWGVMMDDVLAGIYTNIVLQIVRYFL